MGTRDIAIHKNRLAQELLPKPEEPERSLLFYADLYKAIEIDAARSEHTRSAKVGDLKKFVAWFIEANGHTRIEQWLPRDSEGFVQAMAKSYRPASVNRMLATVRHFAKFCLRAGALPFGDPTDGVRDLPGEDLVPKGLTPHQVRRLLKAADVLCLIKTAKYSQAERDKAILLVLYQTGLRVSALCNLDADQFDRRYLRRVLGKGRKVQDVFLPKEAREALAGYLDDRTHGPLVQTRNGNRMSRIDVARALQRIAAQANTTLPDEEALELTPHMLRHTHAQELCDRHGESFAVERLGHASNRYIRRYLKRRPEVEEKMLEEMYE